MNYLNLESEPLLIGNYSSPFGLGYECELIQRAAKAQIIRYLPELTGKLQSVWEHRDKEYEEFSEESRVKLIIPTVKKENIRSGIECFSVLESPPERWPSVLIYAREGGSYTVQEDQFDTSSILLTIEIMCLEGPLKTKELHNIEGLEAMQLLDSKLQRLSDAVYLCIQKDKTLSGSVGQFEKPPKVTTSLPQSLKENIREATGESFILQGKQFEWQTQKISY